MLLRSACRRAGSTCLPRALLVRPLLTQPAPRRLLCSSGDPKVPKGFGRFAKHKPSGTSAAAEGASKEAAEASKAAEGGAKEAAEGSSSSSSSGGSSGSSSSSGTGGGSSSSSGSRRARDPQLRVRHGRRAAGCMCARVGRSGPLPCPAAPAHADCQPGQAAQYCARSGMVEPAGSTGRSACVQPCSVRGAASGGMSACNCFRCGVPGG